MKKIKKYAYMCGVDWQHELGEASGGNVLYPSVENLKRNSSCWNRCGIVRVSVELEEWVEGQDLFAQDEPL